MDDHPRTVESNRVVYRWPHRPVVIVCIDGGDPEYFATAGARGLLPRVRQFQVEEFSAVARAAMPSFTCPNNMSIATGTSPRVHGVSGNYHLDRATGQPVAMTEPGMLRTRTILADFIQHAYAPGEPEADQFYSELDRRFGQLADAGAVVALTADHGMTDMADQDGIPRVVWLQEHLDREFGRGATTVICPITDAFVGHHGALGGFVRVYSHRPLPTSQVVGCLQAPTGIARVWTREEAVRELDLPWEVEADSAVMAREGIALGSRPECHDLAGLRGRRLRSHGSLWEADVPFILNRPLTGPCAQRVAQQPLHNYDVFDFALNGACQQV